MDRLIALYSPTPGCGKTTAARILGGTTISLAAPLRAMVSALMMDAGFDLADAWTLLTQDKEVPIPEIGGRTARYLLRTLGTEWGRDQVDVNLWANLTMAKAARIKGLVVIDDLRFPQEREAVLKAQGEVWRIERPGFARDAEHRSDGAMEDGYEWDQVVVNSGTLDQLRARALDAMNGQAVGC